MYADILRRYAITCLLKIQVQAAYLITYEYSKTTSNKIVITRSFPLPEVLQNKKTVALNGSIYISMTRAAIFTSCINKQGFCIRPLNKR